MTGAALIRAHSFPGVSGAASHRDVRGTEKRPFRSLSMGSSRSAFVANGCRLRGLSALQIQGGITRNREFVNMCLGMSGEDSFFKSSLVQNEMGRLQADYKNLLQIVRKEVWAIRQRRKKVLHRRNADSDREMANFLKRMELSDDFSAKLCAKQLKTSGGPLGLSNVELVTALYTALDDMHRDADEGLER